MKSYIIQRYSIILILYDPFLRNRKFFCLLSKAENDKKQALRLANRVPLRHNGVFQKLKSVYVGKYSVYV